ncbi:helix-turn-helix domain-containing protein [Lysobacter sp. GCM10012299]|uniref:helix-turn-helix domain-containing protein n=1 Tax=Lysobacter sp. GCM10012299 TaxID=3317333 RepID=UPI00362082B5
MKHSVVSQATWATCLGISRMGSLEVLSGELSIWVQMRGCSWIESKEGKFLLRAGGWIVFARDSMPTVQADGRGICVGLTVSERALEAMGQFSDYYLHVGQGQMTANEVREISRLWYRTNHYLLDDGSSRMQASLRAILGYLEHIQSRYHHQVRLCPGASIARKRHVFDRMQRARQYMAGHCNRVVRVGEMAEQTQFSPWYFSKVFHRLYGDAPQKAAAMMRLEHAASLLASTSVAIGDVGVASGFDNNCSFARSFRAKYGMTATSYREVHQSRGHEMCVRRPIYANRIATRRELAQPAMETGIPRSGIAFASA